MAKRKKPPFRADHIGSLLRPEGLLEARSKMKAGQISPEGLRDQEDNCIREIVKLQENVGLRSITDGEFRRESFHVDFISQIENVTSSWDFDQAVQLGKEDKAGQDKKMPYIPYINNDEKFVGEFWYDSAIEGTYSYSNGDVYTGTLYNASKHGFGDYRYANGMRHVGAYNNDSVEGFGTFYFPNGARYEGEFLNGKYQF